MPIHTFQLHDGQKTAAGSLYAMVVGSYLQTPNIDTLIQDKEKLAALREDISKAQTDHHQAISKDPKLSQRLTLPVAKALYSQGDFNCPNEFQDRGFATPTLINITNTKNEADTLIRLMRDYNQATLTKGSERIKTLGTEIHDHLTLKLKTRSNDVQRAILEQRPISELDIQQIAKLNVSTNGIYIDEALAIPVQIINAGDRAILFGHGFHEKKLYYIYNSETGSISYSETLDDIKIELIKELQKIPNKVFTTELNYKPHPKNSPTPVESTQLTGTHNLASSSMSMSPNAVSAPHTRLFMARNNDNPVSTASSSSTTHKQYTVPQTKSSYVYATEANTVASGGAASANRYAMHQPQVKHFQLENDAFNLVINADYSKWLESGDPILDALREWLNIELNSSHYGNRLPSEVWQELSKEDRGKMISSFFKRPKNAKLIQAYQQVFANDDKMLNICGIHFPGLVSTRDEILHELNASKNTDVITNMLNSILLRQLSELHHQTQSSLNFQ